MNGKLWLCDPWNGCVRPVDPDAPEKFAFLGLAGPNPTDLAAAEDGVWHLDAFSPFIVKNDSRGNPLEWGERPFGTDCDGIAWDGRRLWALDGKGGKIQAIEKSANGQ